MTLWTRGSLAHSIRVGELLRVEALAWLHSTSEAVSESPQSVPPFTARDGALKSGGFSRTALCWEGSLTTLNPGWGALKSGGLMTLYSERRPGYTQRQKQLVRLLRAYILTARDGALDSGGFSRRTLLNERKPSTLDPSRGALKSGGLSLATLNVRSS